MESPKVLQKRKSKIVVLKKRKVLKLTVKKNIKKYADKIKDANEIKGLAGLKWKDQQMVRGLFGQKLPEVGGEEASEEGESEEEDIELFVEYSPSARSAVITSFPIQICKITNQ